MNIKTYPSKQEVAEQFSKWLSELITSSENPVHIALSGGSTPKIVFEELVRNYSGIDWSGVHLYWGDERCVPPGDADSNYGMTAGLLLSKIEIPGENIHRIKGENDPAEEAVRYGALLEEKLPEGNGVPRFDLVILGMGDDGHTASVFPHEIDLWASEQNCEVAIHPDTGQKRITITGKLVNNAEAVAFLVTGSGKAEKVREIIHHEGGYATYPASLVAPSAGTLYWFMDEDAANLL